MHLLLICDPPVVDEGYNTGVSQVVRQLIKNLPEHQFTVLTRQIFEDVPPGESAYDCVAAHLDTIDFDHVHLITEGRLALLARLYCNVRGLRYTSACHAQYDMFCQARHGTQPQGLNNYIKWFHSASARVLVPSPSFARLVESRGLTNVVACPNGVDVDVFRPLPDDTLRSKYEAPIWLYVGRLDPEKSIHEFLELELPGTKLVVGDGSIRTELQQRFPNAVFVGLKLGDDLVRHYSSAHAFVFPSRSDTFGLVLPEALACGLPVAAYQGAIGSSDIITSAKVGCLSHDLREACINALKLSAGDCREFALQFAWAERAQYFLSLQVPAHSRANPVSSKFADRFWGKYGAQLQQLEQQVVDVENWLFGGKACFLKPDEEELAA